MVVDHALEVRPAVDGDLLETGGRICGILQIVVPLAVVVPAVEVDLAAGILAVVVCVDVDRGQINRLTLLHLAKGDGLVSLRRVAVAVDHELNGMHFCFPDSGKGDVVEDSVVRARLQERSRIGRRIGVDDRRVSVCLPAEELEAGPRRVGKLKLFGQQIVVVGRNAGDILCVFRLKLDRVERQNAKHIVLVGLNVCPIGLLEDAVLFEVGLVVGRGDLERAVFQQLFGDLVHIGLGLNRGVRLERTGKQRVHIVVVSMEADAVERSGAQRGMARFSQRFTLRVSGNDKDVQVFEALDGDLAVCFGGGLCRPGGLDLAVFNRDGGNGELPRDGGVAGRQLVYAGLAGQLVAVLLDRVDILVGLDDRDVGLCSFVIGGRYVGIVIHERGGEAVR